MWDPENGHPYIRYSAETDKRRARRLVSRARRLVSSLWRWRRPKPAGPRIAVGLIDRRRAGRVRALVARALSERARAIGFRVPAETTILLDRTISGDGSATSCLDVVGSRGTSEERYLVRIALDGEEGPRELDEVIADLDHQVLSLFFHLSGTPKPRPGDRTVERAGDASDWSHRLANPNGQRVRPTQVADGAERVES